MRVEVLKVVTLTMKTAGSCETLLLTFQTTRHHISEEFNLKPTEFFRAEKKLYRIPIKDSQLGIAVLNLVACRQLYIYREYTKEWWFQKLIKIISHTTRAQHTLSAPGTVQVSHALPAVRFSCLLRGYGTSFQDGVT
jgi:hypothetical protein